MICSFCGRTFDEEAARKQCRSCNLLAECAKVKCPYCGFESPKKPRSLKWLNKLRIRKK